MVIRKLLMEVKERSVIIFLGAEFKSHGLLRPRDRALQFLSTNWFYCLESVMKLVCITDKSGLRCIGLKMRLIILTMVLLNSGYSTKIDDR